MNDLPATQPRHADHDRTWIAALAGRDPDLDPATLAAARAQLAACTDCAALYADLIAIAAAIPSAAVPTRLRSFTLTAEDAVRLRPTAWRRLLALVGSSRDGLSRPLALGFTTLGIAGLLVATLPGAFGGAVGGASTAERLETVGQPIENAAGAAAATPEAFAASEAPSSTKAEDGSVFSGGDDGNAAASAASSVDEVAALPQDGPISDDATGVPPLTILAGALLILGIGLFGLRWTARRLGDG